MSGVIGEPEVPDGWTCCSIGEVVEKVPNIRPEDEPDRVFRYVDISSVCNRTYRITEPRRIKGKDAPSRARRPIRPGDVLFSNVRTYLRNVALVTPDVQADVCSTGFTVLRAGHRVLPQYLFYYLLTDEFIGQITPKQTGSNYPATTDRAVLAEGIPLPSLAEQERIVAAVEALLRRVDAARQRLGRLPVVLRRFRETVVSAACRGELTEDFRSNGQRGSVDALLTTLAMDREIRSKGSARAARRDSRPPAARLLPAAVEAEGAPRIPDGWRWLPCASLCMPERALTYGVIKLGTPVPGGVPTLRTSDVRWLRIDEAGVKRISPEIASQYGRTCLVGGELLVNVRGTLGGVAVVPRHMRGWNVSREVAVVPVEPRLCAEYLSLAIGSAWSQRWLTGVTRGVAYVGINIEDLRELPLPIPPVEEQREIVRRVQALFALANQIEERVAVGTAHAEGLTQAILAKAFRGELVPTEAELARQEGREYEPASALLERVRAERAEAPVGRRGRR
jgi:type I restriction enzyme S subunit